MIFWWELPIKTVSESNSSEHWTKKAKRHKQQQFFVRLSFSKVVKEVKFPCIVKLTRLSSRILDDDNLRGCFKWIRDEISECIFPEKRGNFVKKNGKIVQIKGRADSDPRINWEYAQEKAKKQAVRIELSF